MPTIDGRGYPKWDDLPILDGPAGNVSMVIDGYTLTMNPFGEGWSGQYPDKGIVIPMADGTACYQRRIPKPKQPITMSPFVQEFGFAVTYQEDMLRIFTADAAGDPVLMFTGMLHPEVWRIDGMDAGQTELRTSRRTCWNGTTRTHATHPPRAYIKSGDTLTAQTIITTGTPAVGEVKVPATQTAGQYYESITVPVDVVGDQVRLIYWPETLCTLALQHQIATTNGWIIQVAVTEILAGDYS